MKRALLLTAALMFLPAVAIAQNDSPLSVPSVPALSLVPTLYELELRQEQDRYRELIEVQRTVPMYRAPLGDYERELMWGSSPFGSSIPSIVLFRF